MIRSCRVVLGHQFVNPLLLLLSLLLQTGIESQDALKDLEAALKPPITQVRHIVDRICTSCDKHDLCLSATV